MRRLGIALVLALVFSAVAAAAQTDASGISASQLKTRFKQTTGAKLVVNRRSTYPGHYVAFDLGAPSIANKARYGTFTVYLVTGPDVEAETTDLLADGHTGVLGTPGPGNIYWEFGKTVYGDAFWLAKHRYGANVVLWWIGEKPVKKTDATFRRLHTALTKATR